MKELKDMSSLIKEQNQVKKIHNSDQTIIQTTNSVEHREKPSGNRGLRWRPSSRINQGEHRGDGDTQLIGLVGYWLWGGDWGLGGGFLTKRDQTQKKSSGIWLFGGRGK